MVRFGWLFHWKKPNVIDNSVLVITLLMVQSDQHKATAILIDLNELRLLTVLFY
jgi:hypothetical protein